MQQLRRYRLVRTIGAGGMAQVYEAVAEGASGFERKVAIKRVLPERVDDHGIREMFLDEARIASQLYHGNIVQVLDYGFADGTEFIAMEYVDGIDSQKAWKVATQRGIELPESVALYVTSEIAHALHYLHSISKEGRPLGIVHRDVSPANILLSWDGDVKLSDFGIAFAHQKEHRTQTGIVKGKLEFMSPEHARGKPLTGAADVFSLGVSLHAILTGRSPVVEAKAFFMGERDHEIAIADALSRDVRELICDAIAFDAEKRPTAKELAKRAGRIASGLASRDGRGALVEWLTKIKPPMAKPSPFDQMVGLVIEPAGSDRNFVVTREEPRTASDRTVSGGAHASSPTEETKADVPASGIDDSEKGNEAGPAPRRSREWMLLSAVVFPLAIAIAWVGLDGDQATSESSNVAPTPDPSIELPRKTSSSQPTEQTEEVEQTEEIEPTNDVATTTTGGQDEAQAPHEERTLAKRIPTRDPRETERALPDAPPVQEPAKTISDPASTASMLTGWLRIGGERAVGARVELDGRHVGFAPFASRVSAGRHVVVLRSSDGSQVLHRQTLEVGPQHTRASAARVIY